MRVRLPDLTKTGWARVVVLTILGTLFCIAGALAIDSYSFSEGVWRWGGSPWNNVIIPLILAPPFFFYLLSKLRELALAHQKLMVVASTDGLTSCLTRTAFATLVDAYLERFSNEKGRQEGALLIIDVDYFKQVNDSFGHDQGDAALRLIARTIRSSLREVDLFGRIGGEEFSVFLPGVSAQRSEVVAERIRASIKEADFSPMGTRYSLSISIGGATFESKSSFSELYKNADMRLYEAKRRGRNRVEMARSHAFSLTNSVQSH